MIHHLLLVRLLSKVKRKVWKRMHFILSGNLVVVYTRDGVWQGLVGSRSFTLFFALRYFLLF